MENNRSMFWDIIKGLGIIAVVIGHSGSALKPFMYMYHLVLFFFVSGYLYNDKYSADPFLFLGKRVKSQWILAVKYCILFNLLHNVFIKIGIYTNTGLFNLNDLIGNILNSFFLRGFEYMGGALWFIPFLFFGCIGFCFIRSSTYKIKNKAKREIITSAILFIFLLFGLYLIQNQITFDYHLQLIFIVFPILQLAFLLKEYHIILPYKWYLALPATGILVFIWFYTKSNIELSQSFIINGYTFYLVSLAGIYANLYLASKILLNKNLSTLFSYIGNKSFHIMALHFVFFKVVEYFRYFILHKPYSDISIFPFSDKGYWIAYCICGIAFPTLLIYAWEKALEKQLFKKQIDRLLKFNLKY